MPIKYKVEQAKIGFGKDKKEAYVGKIQLGQTVETEMLVEQVSLRTGMTKAQVKMALENMTESIQHFCMLGNGVRLGKLGIIKPAISTGSHDSADAVSVVKLKYNFIPSTEMKEALRALEVRKSGESYDEDEEEDDDESGTPSGGGGGGQELT